MGSELHTQKSDSELRMSVLECGKWELWGSVGEGCVEVWSMRCEGMNYTYLKVIVRF